MTDPIKSPRKLIEVALPLDAINAACIKEKAIRHGHPSTLHLWWARRPLAAARAVIFAQLVNDPGFQQGSGFKYGKNKKDAAVERKRLFRILEDLVLWENINNADVLDRARAEIHRSWREVCALNSDHPRASELFNPVAPPALHDPFSGGGTIPLEGQRLGLDASASDLNPVAVLINKAMIEFPPTFSGRPPVNPEARKRLDHDKGWLGVRGMAADVRYYGKWVRDQAEKTLRHLYPTLLISPELVKRHGELRPYAGQSLTVIAWLWARTVKSPNPAFAHIDVPLASTFRLGTKTGNEAWIEPVIERGGYRFTVKRGEPDNPETVKNGTKLSRGANFQCLMSGTPIAADYIKAEGRAGRMGARMMAIAAEGRGGRVYLAPTPEHEEAPLKAAPAWRPDSKLPDDPRNFWTVQYGLTTWADLFTPRQLAVLTTLSDLVGEVRDQIRRDSVASGIHEDRVPLCDGGSGATAYAEAIAVYLAFALSRSVDRGSTLCSWDSSPKMEALRNTFGRQALPMVWDFAEGNPFSESSGNWMNNVEWVSKAIENLPATARGKALQLGATTQDASTGKVVSTDPPYFDNISYADLSDFFYVWLRRTLRSTFPEILSTLAVPKAEELIATPYRHGNSAEGERFFLDGMTQAMHRLAEQAHPAFPVTIYYAFKQAENDAADGTSNTGWDTFLEAVLSAGFAISGTWPMRTELGNRMISSGTNALASSIVLVCRKRAADAPSISRREFNRELNAVLPEALDEMTKGSGEGTAPVAPVDLSQAIIGPGMAIFSKYTAVLEADGSPMRVRTALQLINRFLTEDDFDTDTQFCLHWFEQHRWSTGRFGDAETLSRAKGTSVDGVRVAGVIESGAGIVRLLKWSEYSADWDPRDDSRNPVWETLHQLIRALKQEGETGAGRLLAMVGGKAEATRQLAYRLYTLCERQGWAEDARAYNELITSWTGIEAAASAIPGQKQTELFQ